MAKATHTPGPWIVSDNKDAVLAATRTIIIAKCNAGPSRFHASVDTIFANARLIASSPKLYDAAVAARNYLCDENRRADDLLPVIEALNAAITNVRG